MIPKLAEAKKTAQTSDLETQLVKTNCNKQKLHNKNLEDRSKQGNFLRSLIQNFRGSKRSKHLRKVSKDGYGDPKKEQIWRKTQHQMKEIDRRYIFVIFVLFPRWLIYLRNNTPVRAIPIWSDPNLFVNINLTP